MGIECYGDKTCKWCGDPKQNRMHLLLKCPRSNIFWKQVEQEFNTIFNIGEINDEVKLVGIQHGIKKYKDAGNLILLLATQIIFDSVIRDFDLNIETLKIRLKTFLIHKNRVNFEQLSNKSYLTLNVIKFSKHILMNFNYVNYENYQHKNYKKVN